LIIITAEKLQKKTPTISSKLIEETKREEDGMHPADIFKAMSAVFYFLQSCL